MKTFLRALGISVCLAAASPVFAQEPVGSNSDITAMGRNDLKHGWMSIYGPDAAGSITVRVRTADLDLRTPAGQEALNQRIIHAKTDLCRTALEDTALTGPQLGAERACLRTAKLAQPPRQALR